MGEQIRTLRTTWSYVVIVTSRPIHREMFPLAH